MAEETPRVRQSFCAKRERMQGRQIVVIPLLLGVSGLRAGSRLQGADPKHRVVRFSHLHSLVATWHQIVSGFPHARWEHPKDRQRVRDRLGVGSVKSNSRISRVENLPQSIDSSRNGSTKNTTGSILSRMGRGSGVFWSLGKAKRVRRGLQQLLGSPRVRKLVSRAFSELSQQATAKGNRPA